MMKNTAHVDDIATLVGKGKFEKVSVLFIFSDANWSKKFLTGLIRDESFYFISFKCNTNPYTVIIIFINTKYVIVKQSFVYN